jgi:MoaA/NifB/PqqE/SkfB family radical SAM enzyme
MSAISNPRNLTAVRPVLRWLGSRRSPWFVTWALTERCNYVCDHCGCWRVPGDEMTPEDALQYAREMVSLGVVAVNLCGGEVLLRPDLGDVIEVLRDGGVVTRVTTNGSMVPARIDELRRLNCLKISLDGPPDLHDEVRGEGAFDKVVAALEAAAGVGIPCVLNTVLTAAVCARLEELLDTVADLGLPVTFNPIELRHDEAAGGVEGATPTPAAMQAAGVRIRALKAAGDPRIGNSVGTLEYMATWPVIEPVDCRAGKRFCRVLSDGRVVACDRPYAPHAPPPPGAPPTGFARGVEALQRAGTCQGCWRNNTIELNRALGGSVAAAGSLTGWFSSGRAG